MSYKVPLWIRNSEIFKSGDYLKYKFNTLPITSNTSITNLRQFKKILKVIFFWKIYQPYPLEIYKYLLKNDNNIIITNTSLLDFVNFPREYKIYYAASINNFELLKYLHENSYPWDEYVTMITLANGNLDMLEYEIVNGCKININDSLITARNLKPPLNNNRFFK